MSESLCIEVARVSDGDAVLSILSLANSPAGQRLNILQIDFFVGEQLSLSRDQFEQNEELSVLKTLQGRTIRKIYLRENPSQSKGVLYSRHLVTSQSRDNRNSLFDQIEIYPGAHNEGPLSRVDFARLAEATQLAFRNVSVKDLGDLLGPDVQKHFVAREEALSRLELLAARILEGSTQQRRELDAEYLQKVRQLEDDRTRQLGDFEKQHLVRQQALSDRENELEKKIQALDDRSSTHVRRELRQAISNAVKDQSRLQLSTDTGKRRWAVIAAYISLLLFTGVPAVFFLATGHGQEFEPWSFGRQVVLSVSFICTTGFFIRLLNDWAEKSAMEEQRLRQTEIDIDRASWLVELIFESKSLKGEELPGELIGQLSKNLFGFDQRSKQISNAAETLATALITSASGLKLNLPAGLGELRLDGNAIKKMKKTEMDVEL